MWTTLMVIGGWGLANAPGARGTELLSLLAALAVTLWCAWEGRQHAYAVQRQQGREFATAIPLGRIQ